jgi:histidine ammonia-lyase
MDRASLAALGARRAAELCLLGKSIVAMELMVAAQSVELRGHKPLGRRTAALLAFAREAVPFAAAGRSPPNVQPLLDHIETAAGRIDALMSRGRVTA